MYENKIELRINLNHEMLQFWKQKLILDEQVEKEKSEFEPSGPSGRVFLLLPGWDASPSQGYLPAFRLYPFIHMGEERHCESKVSCLRTERGAPAEARTRTARLGAQCSTVH